MGETYYVVIWDDSEEISVIGTSHHLNFAIKLFEDTKKRYPNHEVELLKVIKTGGKK